MQMPQWIKSSHLSFKINYQFVLFLFFFNIPYAKCDELSDALLSHAKKQEIFDSGSIDPITINHIKYIVFVGVSKILDSSKKSMMNANRVSRLNAENAAIKFIHGSKIKSDEHLTETYSESKSDEKYEVTQSEHAEADIGDYIEVGNWRSSMYYYSAIAFKLN